MNDDWLMEAFTLACAEVADLTKSCPYDCHDFAPRNCDECDDDYTACWKAYFMKKAVW